MKKLTKILSVILCLAMIMGLATVAFAEETTPKQITSLSELVTGTYTIVSTADANLGVLDGNWVTNASSVWTITVDGTNVKLTDANGTTIAPKGGNNNGIKSGDYTWTVACDDNGLFTFAGQGSDTVMLAFNKQEAKFRAYKTSTIDGNPSGYPTTFKLYEATAGEGGEEEKPADPIEITIPEAIALAPTADSTLYLVRGTVKSIANDYYGNMTIVDDEGNELYIYGTYGADGTTKYGDLTEKPVAGDKVVLVGVLTTYNGNPQMKNATIKEFVVTEKEEEPTQVPAEIEDGTYVIVFDGKTFKALDEAVGFGYAPYTEVTVADGVVSGYTNADIITITNVEGGFTMQDIYGRYIYMKGTYNSFNVSEELPAEGHIWQAYTAEGGVTVMNVLKGKTIAFSSQYSSWGSYADNSSVVNFYAAEIEEEKIPDPVEVTIPDAIAIGEANDSYTVEKYILTGVIVSVDNDVYGNVYIEDEEGNKILIYGLYDEAGNRYDAMNPQPAVGDTITVVGSLGNYQGVAQMKNGVLTEIIPGEPSQTGDPILVAVCALLVSGGAVAILPKKREF